MSGRTSFRDRALRVAHFLSTRGWAASASGPLVVIKYGQLEACVEVGKDEVVVLDHTGRVSHYDTGKRFWLPRVHAHLARVFEHPAERSRPRP